MFDDRPLLVVDDDRGLRALADRLLEARVVAVDTESDSMHHYRERVCLLQFTDRHGDAIVDPLAIDDLSPLGPVFSSPDIVKVLHGADYDIVCLKRDFGFHASNVFDTLVAAQFLGLDRLGLADLIRRWFGHEVDKTLQRHDWSERPLLPDHLDYARGDTHFLPALREILLRHLHRVGRVDHVDEECAVVAAREWQGRTFDPDGWVRIKGARELDEPGQRILRRLWVYRDGAARDLDRPPFKVIGEPVLLDIARARPSSREALERMFPKGRGMLRRHAPSLVQAVREGLADTSPLVIRKRSEPADETEVEGFPARLHGRQADAATEALKLWRNSLVASSRAHTPFSVASNADLRAVARARPTTLDELAAVPGLRRWQVRDHGEALLAVLDRVAPIDGLADPSRKKRRRR